MHTLHRVGLPRRTVILTAGLRAAIGAGDGHRAPAK